MRISSSSNERLKFARRVRDGREEALIFIEGLRLAEEALRSGLVVETVFLGPATDGERQTRLLRQLEERKVPVWTTSAEAIASLSDTVSSQGIVLLARRPVSTPDRLLAAEPSLLIGLDRVQDPGNVGTLLRTAEAAGAGGMVALEGCADIFAPKTLRSTMGSAFRLPVLAGITGQQLRQFCSDSGLSLVAAAGGGELDYCAYDWQQPTLLLMGNEARGVAPELLEACDARLHIPMANGVESLNVAAAGAVLLFEAARQRRQVRP